MLRTACILKLASKILSRPGTKQSAIPEIDIALSLGRLNIDKCLDNYRLHISSHCDKQ